MDSYTFANYELSIFGATGVVITLNSAGQPVDHSINVVTITTDEKNSNDGA